MNTQEQILLYCDADRRAQMTAEEIAACPTVGEAEETQKCANS